MSNISADRDRMMQIGRTISALRSKFVRHRKYLELKEQFDILLYRRRAEQENGGISEARGLALIGESASGKSTALNHLFSSHGDLQLLETGVERADVASFLVPSPASLKHVGMSCLNGLGYPLRRDRAAGIIWELVWNSLKRRETLFLHLDEAQDLYVNSNVRERQSVVNTLKSLMQNKEWPTGIILSGMPNLRDLLNLDPQLARRFVPIHFSSIGEATDRNHVAKIVQQYTKAAGLVCVGEVSDIDFIRRLIHAGASQLGLTIELIIAAIEDALLTSENELRVENFVNAFRRRSGCIDDFNPFVRADFREINPRLLMGVEAELGSHCQTLARH